MIVKKYFFVYMIYIKKCKIFVYIVLRIEYSTKYRKHLTWINKPICKWYVYIHNVELHNKRLLSRVLSVVPRTHTHNIYFLKIHSNLSLPLFIDIEILHTRHTRQRLLFINHRGVLHNVEEHYQEFFSFATASSHQLLPIVYTFYFSYYEEKKDVFSRSFIPSI